MNKELMKNWVDALRNGEYPQTNKRLFDTHTNGFCCLGVLCDITKEQAGGKCEGW